MIEQIRQTVEKYHLLEQDETVVIALSGGADSCALLLALQELAPEWHLKLVVAHFNHGLRGAHSLEDEAFCARLAEKFALDFVTEKMKQRAVPQGLSAEDYYRQQRYAFLDRVAGDVKAAKIALGHHLHDQAETVLINVLRGSGLDGLKGFLPMRDQRYIRPLLEVSRKQIEAFLAAAGIGHREDLSNQNTAHLRNRIRHELLPFLREKYNPAIEKTLSRMADILRRDDDLLNEQVRQAMGSPDVCRNPEEVSFSVGFFRTLPDALGYRFIKALLESLVRDEKGFSFAHIQSVRDLALNRQTGKKVSLPRGLCARKEYDTLLIGFLRADKKPDYEYPIIIPGTVDLKERGIILSSRLLCGKEVDFSDPARIYMDRDRIQEPLVIRNRRKGDWFQPLGTCGKQKIKKLFIDRKIPPARRETTALIADRESVLWVENLHLCDRVKVSAKTKQVVVLEMCCTTAQAPPAQENI